MLNIEDFKFKHYDSVDSTNNEALKLVISENVHYIVTADAQTHGRGKNNRLWHSYKGNFFYSFAFLNDGLNPLHCTYVASLAVLETLVSLDVAEKIISLKWPNDILLNEKKLCGILTEHHKINNLSVTIIGVGLNILHHPSQQLIFPATSLKNQGYNISVEKILKMLSVALINNLNIFITHGFENIKRRWLNHAYNLSKTISIDNKTGIFQDIDEEGCLILNINGKLIAINSGDVF